MLIVQPVRGVCVVVLAVAAILSSACGGRQTGQPQGDFKPQVGVVTLKAQPVTLTRELPGRTTAYLQ